MPAELGQTFAANQRGKPDPAMLRRTELQQESVSRGRRHRNRDSFHSGVSRFRIETTSLKFTEATNANVMMKQLA
jgi:hypothetical protein